MYCTVNPTDFHFSLNPGIGKCVIWGASTLGTLPRRGTWQPPHSALVSEEVLAALNSPLFLLWRLWETPKKKEWGVQSWCSKHPLLWGEPWSDTLWHMPCDVVTSLPRACPCSYNHNEPQPFSPAWSFRRGFIPAVALHFRATQKHIAIVEIISTPDPNWSGDPFSHCVAEIL